MDLHIRWMIRRDMPSVLAIEAESFEFPWSQNDFEECLRQRNCTGMIAELGDTIVGATVYELCERRLHLLNFSVAKKFRRRGIGWQMISRLVGKLSQQRRRAIWAEVRESNLPAQLFFSHFGFRAVNIAHDFYDDTDEDAYLFQYACSPIDPGLTRNRIAGLV
jgi:ribosomal-protein-alanine N-acetyltransferase